MTHSNEIPFLTGAPFAPVVRFALPVAATGILQLLFNAADIIVVGRFAGNDCLAAVGATTSLISLLISAFMGVSVGVNILTARLLGSGQTEQAAAAAHCALSLGAMLGLAVLLVGQTLAAPLLRAMRTPEALLPLSVLYLRIYFFGVPAQLLYNFAAAILRAQGQTQRPLRFLLVSGTANIVLNLFFVLALHMGVAGVAIATCVSQYLTLALIARFLFRPGSGLALTLRPRAIRFVPRLAARMLDLGLPSGLQSVIFNAANVLIQSAINSFGAAAIAGNTAANNLDAFIYTAASALFHTALTFTSQNAGAGRYDRLPRIWRACLLAMLLLVVPLCALTVAFGPQLLALYISPADPARDKMLACGMTRLTILGASYCLSGFMEINCGMIRGLGRSWLPLIVSVAGACGLRILWLYTVFPLRPTLAVLYLCFPVSWLVTGAVHALCFRFELHKQQKTAR